MSSPLLPDATIDLAASLTHPIPADLGISADDDRRDESEEYAGIEHLHKACSPPVVPMDLKASYRLLDLCFEPKNTDFDTSRIIGAANDTHVSMVRAVGDLSPGYMPVKQLMTVVYSFCVMLLEIITRRQLLKDLCYGSTSVRLPLAQMMLFSHKLTRRDTFACTRSMVRKGVISAKPKSESPKAGTVSEFNPRESIGRSNEPSIPVFSDISNMEEISSTISATPRLGDNGFTPNSGAHRSSTTNAEGNRVRNHIFMLSRAGNGGFSSEGTGSTLTGDNHHSGTDSASNDNPVVLLDSQAHATCTGNFSVLSSPNIASQDVVLVAANGMEMPIIISGSVRSEKFELDNVHFNPDLGNRIIVSGSELDKLDYSYEFARGECTVRDLRTLEIVGKGRCINNDYIMDYLKIPYNRVPGLVPVPEGRSLPLGPVPEEPGLVTSVWKAVFSVLCSFTGPLFQRTSAQTPRRPPI